MNPEHLPMSISYSRLDRAFIAKLAHMPSISVRAATREEAIQRLDRLTRRLFGLLGEKDEEAPDRLEAELSRVD